MAKLQQIKFVKTKFLPILGHLVSVICVSSDFFYVRSFQVYESTTEMVLVLELAAGGELQHILDGDNCFEELEARKVMRQILEGVAYLHSRNIAHLDLKPQNILLATEDSCDDIKLCDFGISKVLEPGVKVREILGKSGNGAIGRLSEKIQFKRVCGNAAYSLC